MHSSSSLRLLNIFTVATVVALLLAEFTIAQGFGYLQLKVVDPEGKPMEGVNVDISLTGMEFPMPTNKDGVVALNVPAGGDSAVQVVVKHDGYAAQGVLWDRGEKLPKEFTIPMKKGSSIGGIVQDEQGQPIEGVKIEGLTIVTAGSARLSGGGKLQPHLSGELATTDKEGKWVVGFAPEEPLDVQLRITPPDYVNNDAYSYVAGTWDELRSLKKIVVLKKGIAAEGIVADLDGKPIVGAKIGLGTDYINQDKITRTDQDGHYKFSSVAAGGNMLTVVAPGFAPQYKRINVKQDMPPVNFKLEPGHKIKFKVVDPDGKPVAGAMIAADTWQNTRTLMSLADRVTTDAEGLGTWDGAPADEVQMDMFCRGYMSVRGRVFSPRDEPYELTMPKALRVSGKVVDAEGKPIETFSVIEGIKWDAGDQPVYWERYNTQAGKAGAYTMEFDEPRAGHLVRVEASGYRPGISRIIKDDEQDVTIDFKLAEGSGPTGVVKRADGTPVEGVQVLMALVGSNQIQISNGLSLEQPDSIQTETDGQGRFTLPVADSEYKLICLSDEGWSDLDKAEDDGEPLEIVLKPWAKVEGMALRGKKPRVNEKISLYQATPYEPNKPHVYWSYNTKTDAEGKFTIHRVRDGMAQVGLVLEYGQRPNLGGMSTNTHTVPVDVKPGENTTVQIGGEGRSLKGKLSVPKDYKGEITWDTGVIQLNGQPPTAVSGNVFHSIGKLIAQSTTTPTRTQTPPVYRSYAMLLDDSGNFEIDDVMPGSYRLSATIYRVPESTTGYTIENFATFQLPVTVAEGPEGEVIDLGEHELTIIRPAPPQAIQGGSTFIQATPVPQ